MEKYVKLGTDYDHLTPFHGRWVTYMNVRTKETREIEEENESEFIGNHEIMSWKEYTRYFEYQKFGILTNEIKKYGLLGKEYRSILENYCMRLDEIFPKLELFFDSEKGYFDLRFLEILSLISKNKNLVLTKMVENEGVFYKRDLSYEKIDELVQNYRQESLQLLLARYYQAEKIEDKKVRKKVEDTVYHLLAGHENVDKTCDEMLDINENFSFLGEEEKKAILDRELIPWTLRIHTEYNEDALKSGMMGLTYIGTNPFECAISNQRELAFYLKNNPGKVHIFYRFLEMLTSMEKDYFTLIQFSEKQLKQDCTISLNAKQKVYTLGRIK